MPEMVVMCRVKVSPIRHTEWIRESPSHSQLCYTALVQQDDILKQTLESFNLYFEDMTPHRKKQSIKKAPK